jgi:phage terminase large subunit-like protein
MPGDMADPSLIKKEIYETHVQLHVREVGFDPWGFSVAAAEINQGGITCVGVPQTVKELSAPSRELLGAINSGKLVHFGNPYLSWCASNVVFVENEKNSGVKPEKLSYAEKIDAISAIVNAWHRLLAEPPISQWDGNVRWI